MRNVDPIEIAKFSENAAHWWDLKGEFKALHEINPLRLSYIQQKTVLAGKKVLDIGCGGGILTESLARAGAIVTGLDMSEAALQVAKLHQFESNLQIDYLHTSAEEFAEQQPGQYDVVTCLEMLEHVPDPISIITAASRLVKSGGDIFFSTLNRTAKAYLFAIIGAEYILKLLPQNTHDFAKFIRPSELCDWVRKTGMDVSSMAGIGYHPFTKKYFLTEDVSVNYLIHVKKT